MKDDTIRLASACDAPGSLFSTNVRRPQHRSPAPTTDAPHNTEAWPFAGLAVAAAICEGPRGLTGTLDTELAAAMTYDLALIYLGYPPVNLSANNYLNPAHREALERAMRDLQPRLGGTAFRMNQRRHEWKPMRDCRRRRESLSLKMRNRQKGRAMERSTSEAAARKDDPTTSVRFEILDFAEAAQISVARARKLIMQHGDDRESLIAAARLDIADSTVAQREATPPWPS